MSDHKTDYTPYLLQTQTDVGGRRIGDYIIPVASLRDQFAMAALKGLLSNNVADHVAVRKSNEIADLMMERRK
ncbi:hypothetical protein [Caudoviricetes sp.]|nr:hypothetical protein [Caudoviricetes sp.]